MTHTLAILALVLYIVTSLWFLISVVKMKCSAWASRLFACGFTLHSLTLALVLSDSALRFLDNGADYFFVVSWALGLVFLFLIRKFNYPIFGAFFLPLITLTMGSSSVLLHTNSTSVVTSQSVPTEEEVALALIHAVPAVVAVVSLAVALISSAIFLVFQRRLKKKGSAALSMPGPNLSALHVLGQRAVLSGFIAISMVVITGVSWSIISGRGFVKWDLSTMSGLGVWCMLAGLIYARANLGWSSPRVSRLTILVTGVFFISVFIIALFSGSLSHGGALK